MKIDQKFEILSPKDATAENEDYEKLGKQWWEHFSQIDIANNQLYDTGRYRNGDRCNFRQENSKVIFFSTHLGGLNGEIRRECYLSKGKLAFFALLNWSSDDIEFPKLNNAERDSLAKQFINNGQIEFSIDGEIISPDKYYPVETNGVEFKYGDCLAYTPFGFTKGQTNNSNQYGKYILVRFSEGNHEAHIRATAQIPRLPKNEKNYLDVYIRNGRYEADVVYDLKVS